MRPPVVAAALAFSLALVLGGCTPASDDSGAGGAAPSTCDDGVKNGDETAVDCGGTCGPCGVGKACASAGDCQGGHCSDGVCCSAACDGACVACSGAKTGAPDGTCAPVKADTDPDSECEATDPASCGVAGTGCNGDTSAPACKVHPEGTVCAKPACSDGKITSARACDGKGTCAAGVTVDCAPKECATSSDACAETCTKKDDCVVGFTCQVATGTCIPEGNTGGACSKPGDCSSGFCSDGVCCNQACDGGCDACSIAQGAAVDGACTVRTTGSSGEPGCTPYVCDGKASSCPTSCGSDAGCDAGHYCDKGSCAPKKALAGACQAGVECASGFCSDGVCCDAACGGACDACTKALGATATGTCTPLADGATGSPSCAPFLCDGKGGACPKTCALDVDCVASAFCAGNLCVPKKANGGTCAATKECSSGLCVDGVCCNTTCTAKCMACNVKNLEGTCSFVPDGLDPTSECIGHCDGQGSCESPDWTHDARPILEQKCGPCHTMNGSGGTNFAATYADAVIPSKSCPGKNVAECSLVRIKNGTMPKNKNCTGDPNLDAANLDCLTAKEQLEIETWVLDGYPQ